MKYAQIVGRVFSTRQYATLDGLKMLLIQPLDWEKGEPSGDPLVAADTVGTGASEFVYWVASREAAVAFKALPPIDAAILGIVEGKQVRDFRKRMKKAEA